MFVSEKILDLKAMLYKKSHPLPSRYCLCCFLDFGDQINLTGTVKPNATQLVLLFRLAKFQGNKNDFFRTRFLCLMFLSVTDSELWSSKGLADQTEWQPPSSST